jgi:hypothetical protein
MSTPRSFAWVVIASFNAKDIDMIIKYNSSCPETRTVSIYCKQIPSAFGTRDALLGATYTILADDPRRRADVIEDVFTKALQDLSELVHSKGNSYVPLSSAIQVCL